MLSQQILCPDTYPLYTPSRSGGATPQKRRSGEGEGDGEADAEWLGDVLGAAVRWGEGGKERNITSRQRKQRLPSDNIHLGYLELFEHQQVVPFDFGKWQIEESIHLIYPCQ